MQKGLMEMKTEKSKTSPEYFKELVASIESCGLCIKKLLQELEKNIKK